MSRPIDDHFPPVDDRSIHYNDDGPQDMSGFEPWPGPDWGPVQDRAPRILPYIGFDDIDVPVSKPWIMKGVCAQRETWSLIGAPGTGKSAIAGDLCVHISAGRDWRGFRSKGVFGVAYFAFERGDLLKRRLEAYKRSMGFQSLPFVVITAPVDLMAPTSVDTVIATIRDIGRKYRVPMGMFVVDTFAKAIAIGGGDENSAKDQNRLLSHVRDIEAETDVHALLIGHTGKDETKGARGSNAHLGDVDVMGVITGDRVKELAITKANDQPEGPLTTYTLESYSFGTDEDGDPITTGMVSQSSPGPVEKKPASAGLTSAEKTAYRMLRKAIEEAGETPPVSDHIPAHTKTVPVTLWRKYCYQGGISAEDSTEDARKKAFKRAAASLQGKAVVQVWEPHVWIARDVKV